MSRLLQKCLEKRNNQEKIVKMILDNEDAGLKVMARHICKIYNNYNYVGNIWQKTHTQDYIQLKNMLRKERDLRKRKRLEQKLQQETQTRQELMRSHLKMCQKVTTQQSALSELTNVGNHYRSEIAQCKRVKRDLNNLTKRYFTFCTDIYCRLTHTINNTHIHL